MCLVSQKINLLLQFSKDLDLDWFLADSPFYPPPLPSFSSSFLPLSLSQREQLLNGAFEWSFVALFLSGILEKNQYCNILLSKIEENNTIFPSTGIGILVFHYQYSTSHRGGSSRIPFDLKGSYQFQIILKTTAAVCFYQLSFL